MRVQLLITLLPWISGFASGQASIFVGAAGQRGDVLIVGHSDVRPTSLREIVLLPLDVVGRTQLTDLVAGQARLRTDVPGAARLQLPEDRGSLYKFQRTEPAGSATFGFFLVRPSGIASTLFELAGTGPARSTDPFVGNLAVSADGHSFLVATSRDAGGDLWEIGLTGTAINRTLGLAPQGFVKNGLVLLDTWGVGVALDGVFRFDRVLGGGARPVGLPIVAGWFGADTVHSADESTVAFLAGDLPTRALLLTLRRRGDATLVSDRPMNIPGAGFLPEDPSGPAIALSTDGSWIAWRGEGGTREVFVRETRPGPRAPRQHVTGPALFDNTLDDTGVISFFDPDSVVFVAGKQASAGIARADLYRLDLSPTGIAASNLSLTSGVALPPFDYGTLSTADGLFQVPGSSTSFVLHDRAGGGRLLWVDAAGSVAPFLDRVRSLDSLDVSGTYLVAGVTRPPGVDDPLVETINVVQIPGGGVGAIAVLLPRGCHLTRTVGSRSRNVFAAVLELPGGERLGRFQVPSLVGMTVSPGLLEFGPTTGISPEGAVLASVEVAHERAAFSWSDLGTSLLKVTRAESFLLPGL